MTFKTKPPYCNSPFCTCRPEEIICQTTRVFWHLHLLSHTHILAVKEEKESRLALKETNGLIGNLVHSQLAVSDLVTCWKRYSKFKTIYKQRAFSVKEKAVDSYSLPEAKPHLAGVLHSTATILANSLRKQLVNQITASLFDSTNQIPILLPVTNWITGALEHLTNHIICRTASEQPPTARAHGTWEGTGYGWDTFSLPWFYVEKIRKLKSCI